MANTYTRIDSAERKVIQNLLNKEYLDELIMLKFFGRWSIANPFELVDNESQKMAQK